MNIHSLLVIDNNNVLHIIKILLKYYKLYYLWNTSNYIMEVVRILRVWEIIIVAIII